MIKIVTVAEMRAIEQEGDAAGVSTDQMMINAGRALADRVLEILADRSRSRIVVLVGPGNNGGDALVAGRFIAQGSQHEVIFYLIKPRSGSDPNYAAIRQLGLSITEVGADPHFDILRSLINTCQIVVDGVLGIGLRLPLKGELADFMHAARQAVEDARRKMPRSACQAPAVPAVSEIGETPYVVAVDCPSGLDCDTGAMDALTLHADETVTFAAAKIGQTLFPGAGACGRLFVADIGLPEQLPARDNIALSMPAAADIRAVLPPVPPNAHKGTFGRVLNITGSLNYMGAAVLAARVAYYAGSGLVTVGAPEMIIPVLAAQIPEATWLPLPHEHGALAEGAAETAGREAEACEALLLGPGWGRAETTRRFLLAVLDQGAHLPAVVIDADALNLLSTVDAWWNLLPSKAILTPHPGEMARLTGMTRDEVNAHRVALAREKAAQWGCVVLLKGAFTVIAAPDGQAVILPFAEPALATAGTGDVLAGIAASLLGQGLSPFAAAMAAGFLHGLAGTVAAQRAGTARSVTAGSVLAALPEAMRQVEHAL